MKLINSLVDWIVLCVTSTLIQILWEDTHVMLHTIQRHSIERSNDFVFVCSLHGMVGISYFCLLKKRVYAKKWKVVQFGKGRIEALYLIFADDLI